MRCFVQLLFVVGASVCLYTSCCASEFKEQLEDGQDKWPTIGISILVKDKAHSLPFTLTCLKNQDYPKERLYLWFYMDYSADNSLEIVELWSKKYKKEYKNIHLIKETQVDVARSNSSEWTTERLQHLITLREKALYYAKIQWADYIFMLDADVFLTDPMTLKSLIDKNLPIVAPMLISDGLYSNFWDGMTEKYYYEKSERYEKMTSRELQGCFKVPMVHSAVLIDLRPKKSNVLSYEPKNIDNYDGPVDDIIAFAMSATLNDIPMEVCNDRLYGFIAVPVDMNHTSMSADEREQLVNVKMEALSQGVELPLDPELAKFVKKPRKDKFGLDQIFMINLERRPERRRLMELSFDELGIEAVTVKAVDGMELDMSKLDQYGVTLMPKYEDPYHKRPMKAGEVGCFLSHFSVWKEIAKRNHRRSLVLEDDIRFTSFFRRRFERLLKSLQFLEWDLVYIGRKILVEDEEFVSPNLVKPQYSYWTLGYLLSEDGARKLIRAEPLAKMLPVDEFLPIMFDQHPNDTWRSYFPRRDLVAYSAAPLLVFPTHYTGEPGYVSDTEDSEVLASDERMGAKSL